MSVSRISGKSFTYLAKFENIIGAVRSRKYNELKGAFNAKFSSHFSFS